MNLCDFAATSQESHQLVSNPTNQQSGPSSTFVKSHQLILISMNFPDFVFGFVRSQRLPLILINVPLAPPPFDEFVSTFVFRHQLYRNATGFSRFRPTFVIPHQLPWFPINISEHSPTFVNPDQLFVFAVDFCGSLWTSATSCEHSWHPMGLLGRCRFLLVHAAFCLVATANCSSIP